MRVRKDRAVGRILRAAANTAALFLAAGMPAQAGVIPRPNHRVPGTGEWTIDAGTVIAVRAGDTDAAAAAAYLQDLWRRSNSLDLKISPPAGARAGVISFRHQRGMAPEGYRLRIAPEGAVISASTAAGLFYGAVTLWQLLPPGSDAGRVAAQTIDDAPRFAWRGLMLDFSRHFQSPAFIRSMIDWMAWHKLNVLQWHLTDDQGWRLQIRRYPDLTSVGAWRDHSSDGGFYTQDEVRELVAYAAARHIAVVPEIDMPGHATAAIAAYPDLGSVTQPLSVSSRWGVHQHLFNLEPATLAFLENVLTEVRASFPSRY